MRERGAHDRVGGQLIEQFGADEVVRLEAEGAGMDVDDVLGKARGWLGED